MRRVLLVTHTQPTGALNYGPRMRQHYLEMLLATQE
jgi:hypothetical protein